MARVKTVLHLDRETGEVKRCDSRDELTEWTVSKPDVHALAFDATQSRGRSIGRQGGVSLTRLKSSGNRVSRMSIKIQGRKVNVVKNMLELYTELSLGMFSL